MQFSRYMVMYVHSTKLGKTSLRFVNRLALNSFYSNSLSCFRRMEMERFELLTPCLQGRCSPNWATPPLGTNNINTLMGLSGLEPPTSRLSGVRSNRLSYKPIQSGIHLLSRAVSSKVPSAAYVLTIVFGMGTGVSHKRIDTTNLNWLLNCI